MKEAITKFAPVLKRLFHTNGLTTFGGLLCLVGAVLLALKYIDKELAVEIVGAGTTVIGLGAKDGVREGQPTVAPESLDAPDVSTKPASPPLTAVVALFCLGLLALTSCLGSKASPAPLDAVSAALLAPRPLPGMPVDTTRLAAHQLPAYLVAPPADLSKRERRQFRRAQRRALVEAARQVPAKVKLGANSAYAPDGTAVAAPKAKAPFSAGPDASTTDNSRAGQHANGAVATAGSNSVATPSGGGTETPKPGLLARIVSAAQPYALGALGLVVVGGLLWLRLGPVGSGLRLAASAARRAISGQQSTSA